MSETQETRFWERIPAEERVDILARAVRRVFAVDAEIFHQGDLGDGMYLIESGEVRITVDDPDHGLRDLSRLKAGEFFGEMAVLDGCPRSATALAATEVVVRFFPRAEVLRLLDRMPGLAVALLRQISARFRDFSRQHVEEMLRAERLALVGKFAGAIVHDIRNPLNLISVSAELACQQITAPEVRELARGRILKQVDRIGALIGEILDFTKGNDTDVALLRADFSRLFPLFLDEVRPRLAHAGVALVLESAPPAVPVAADPDRLERAFHNLLHNAVDAMPGGGRIHVRFSVTDTSVLTEIEDTGPGIPEELKFRLFQPFATHGKAAGTGLGLSISKRIVEAHGGRVRHMDRPGPGAVFMVELPRAVG
jgi:signal transduction histidine kinase